MAKYFSYGSNLATQRMQKRAPSSQVCCKGYLEGYELRFHKRSVDGSAKANALHTGTKNDVVRGVVWDIPEADDLQALDRIEGVGHGYDRIEVAVRTREGSISAFTYLAQPHFIDDSLLPYDWYVGLVLGGGREHKFPEEYLKHIELVKVCPDPDPARDLENRYRTNEVRS